MVIDSFWIGSIAVIVLTGLYTCLGGMRAVAYNDAVQVGGGGRPHRRLRTAHLLRAQQTRRIGMSSAKPADRECFNLWKPIVPDGQIATWAPVKEMANGQIIKQAWYFNNNFPWLGMAICAPVIGLWYWCTGPAPSCSARWVHPTSTSPGRVRSSPRFSSCSRSICSSSGPDLLRPGEKDSGATGNDHRIRRESSQGASA